MPPESSLAIFQRIDGSLLSLRRLVDAPRSIPPSRPDRHLDVSTVLVVDAVARSGHAGLVSVADIADRLDVVPSTASRLVSRAVLAGMVAARPDGLDGRRVGLSLTARGRRLHRRAVQFRARRLAGALDSWSAADLVQFDRLLHRFAADTRSLVASRRSPVIRGATDRRRNS